MKRVIDDITRFIFVSDEPSLADIIFIPGGSHPQPAECAAALYRRGFAPSIMPSGRYYIENKAFPGVRDDNGRYTGNYATEYEFMLDVLIKNGVPKEYVLKEDASTYTMENAFFSKNACDRFGISIKSAILCCKSFHARRALMYYQSAFPETVFMVVPSDVSGISASNWYTTPNGFNRVMAELAKCGSQAAEVVKQALKYNQI